MQNPGTHVESAQNEDLNYIYGGYSQIQSSLLRTVIRHIKMINYGKFTIFYLWLQFTFDIDNRSLFAKSVKAAVNRSFSAFAVNTETDLTPFIEFKYKIKKIYKFTSLIYGFFEGVS